MQSVESGPGQAIATYGLLQSTHVDQVRLYVERRLTLSLACVLVVVQRWA